MRSWRLLVKIGADVGDDSIMNGQILTRDSPFQLDQTREAGSHRSVAGRPSVLRSKSLKHERRRANGWLVRPRVRPLSMSPRRPSSRVTAFTTPSAETFSKINDAVAVPPPPFFLPVRVRPRPSIATIRHHFPPVFNRRHCRRHVFARLIWPSLPPSFLPLNSLGRLIW